MARMSLRPLYRATSDGRLDRYLDGHPEVVAPEIVAALEADFARAVEFGDLGAAALAAEAAASLHFALGDESASAARWLDLVGLEVRSAQTVEDLQHLRRSALAAGARAQDAGLGRSADDCRLIAADADLRLAEAKRSGSYPDDAWLTHLLPALRTVADVAETFAEAPPDQRDAEHVQRFTVLLAAVGDLAIGAGWPVQDLLEVRALLRRCSRAGERVVPAGLVPRIVPDPAAARRVESALVRLFVELAD